MKHVEADRCLGLASFFGLVGVIFCLDRGLQVKQESLIVRYALGMACLMSSRFVSWVITTTDDIFDAYWAPEVVQRMGHCNVEGS